MSLGDIPKDSRLLLGRSPWSNREGPRLNYAHWITSGASPVSCRAYLQWRCFRRDFVVIGGSTILSSITPSQVLLCWGEFTNPDCAWSRGKEFSKSFAGTSCLAATTCSACWPSLGEFLPCKVSRLSLSRSSRGNEVYLRLECADGPAHTGVKVRPAPCWPTVRVLPSRFRLPTYLV